MLAKLTTRALPITQFALALTQASLNDPRAFAISLFTPTFMLVLFWVVGRPTEPGDPDLVSYIFPSIVGLTVMLGGQSAAMRIVNWRQQGIFQRLAATPTPLGDQVLSLGLAQALVSVAQAILVLLFGVLVLGLRVDGAGATASVGVLALGVLVFIAFGILVASVSNKPEVASSIFMFTLLPMFFLGGGFPPEFLPDALQPVSPWLPTTMLNNLLNPLLANGALPAEPWWPALGLLVYMTVFAALAAWKFKWE
jgi:ABC-type multidrug transport system permease subunit